MATPSGKHDDKRTEQTPPPSNHGINDIQMLTYTVRPQDLTITMKIVSANGDSSPQSIHRKNMYSTLRKMAAEQLPGGKIFSNDDTPRPHAC